jgi:hypothetical protein
MEPSDQNISVRLCFSRTYASPFKRKGGNVAFKMSLAHGHENETSRTQRQRTVQGLEIPERYFDSPH